MSQTAIAVALPSCERQLACESNRFDETTLNWAVGCPEYRRACCLIVEARGAAAAQPESIAASK
jgi:hypothetical protein